MKNASSYGISSVNTKIITSSKEITPLPIKLGEIKEIDSIVAESTGRNNNGQENKNTVENKSKSKSKVIEESNNNPKEFNSSNDSTSGKNKNNIPSKLEMTKKYNDLAMRLNKIREQAKEYRNLGNYFSQLISANENYEFVYPNVIRKLLEDYYRMSNVLLRFMKIRNDRMTEMNNEFDEEVRKYSLTFPESI